MKHCRLWVSRYPSAADHWSSRICTHCVRLKIGHHAIRVRQAHLSANNNNINLQIVNLSTTKRWNKTYIWGFYSNSSKILVLIHVSIQNIDTVMACHTFVWWNVPKAEWMWFIAKHKKYTHIFYHSLYFSKYQRMLSDTQNKKTVSGSFFILTSMIASCAVQFSGEWAHTFLTTIL